MDHHQEPVWTERMRKPPFSKPHFTEEMVNAVMQKTKDRKRIYRVVPIVPSFIAATIVTALFIGFTSLNFNRFFQDSHQSASSVANNWEPSRFFIVNGHQLLGHEGKVGLMKMNGENDEAFLTSGRGIYYQIYFWGKSDKFSGKYKLIGTKKDTNEVIKLYEWPIEVVKNEIGADALSGGKFVLDKPGLWRLDVYVNEIYFDNIIVDVK